MVAMILHSSFEPGYLWLILVGGLIGVLASMLGTGGGFFFLFVLILFFKVPTQIAVASSLAATLPICIVGLLGHYRHGHIDFRTGLLFILTGIIGALGGASLATALTSGQLKTFFGIYLILLGIHIFYNDWKRKRARKKGITGSRMGRIPKSSFFGFLAGVISGTFGTSGAAPVLAGLLSIRLPVKLVAGTSLMVVLVNTVSALGAHVLVGKIDLMLVYFLATGAVIGAFFGPKLLSGLKPGRAEGPVRNGYAIALLVFGAVMIVSR